MPLTFPAHQAAVLPLKLRWPDRIDGTALCVAAAAPDLSYPVLLLEGHSLLGVAVFAIPLTLVACAVLRSGVARVVAANFPDLGPLRVRSYGVISARRPAFWQTLSSAVIGSVSHIAIDTLTHADRFGARALGLDRLAFVAPRLGPQTIADVLQILGHSVGSLIGIALFVHIGRHRLLERWYGNEAVADARSVRPELPQRLRFWAVAAITAALMTLASWQVPVRHTFKIMLGIVVGIGVAGWLGNLRSDHPDRI
ncbi:MAG: DUF4184 family protein [Microthrixaceae bacterium]